MLSLFNTTNENEIIWYIFDVISLLQGVFLSLSYVPNKDAMGDEEEETQNSSRAEENDNLNETVQNNSRETLELQEVTNDTSSIKCDNNSISHL